MIMEFMFLTLSFFTFLVQGQQAGKMTMWSTNPDVIQGSMCEYANPPLGRSSPSAIAPAIQNLNYCATNVAILGQVCGNCYEVSYDGSPATDPGRAGKAVVQIVDGGATEVFDCQDNVFHTITGANTGVFPITYKQVDCEVAAGGPRAMVVDGTYNNNGNNVKMIFANLPKTVTGAKMAVTTKADGSIREFTFVRSGDSAVWRGSGFGDYGTNIPEGGATTFTLTLGDGSTVPLENCFKSWPKPGGEWCSVLADGKTRSPSMMPTMSPTSPTLNPTMSPTSPTLHPTLNPTFSPTNAGACADIASTSTCEQHDQTWQMCQQQGNWWRTQCKKTCRLCGDQPKPQCRDIMADCEAQQGNWDMCSNSWWKAQCRKTCGACN